MLFQRQNIAVWLTSTNTTHHLELLLFGSVPSFLSSTQKEIHTQQWIHIPNSIPGLAKPVFLRIMARCDVGTVRNPPQKNRERLDEMETASTRFTMPPALNA